MVLCTTVVFFSVAGYSNTAFYPSKFDLQSSLTIANASSSHCSTDRLEKAKSFQLIQRTTLQSVISRLQRN
ncbi:MAG: hypothetical protein B6I37_02750 [Desulfobacteraceae bacterium 4572_35.2]|nr:MAG: hypothetical protein B6I37_02750 [Desulfobacteraceae bacterium 4572_35.2]